jgi:hypothetical protein
MEGVRAKAERERVAQEERERVAKTAPVSVKKETPRTGMHPAMARGVGEEAVAPRLVTEGVAEAGKKNDFAGYSVDISANEKLQLPGPSGQMRVWIGDPQFVPAKEEGMLSQTVPLGATGTTARVEPFVPDKISVEPTGSKCGRIVPSGSVFLFKLTPLEAGHFTVGAKVELYDSPDCSGTQVPKATKSVQVEVEVCTLCNVKGGLGELARTAWEAFKKFWGELLLLFFTLLLFLIRKKLSKWFGFKSE